MEDLANQSLNLDIGKRILIIVIFLSLMWFILNYLAIKIKSGKMQLPDFLRKKFFSDDNTHKEIHKIELLQRQHLVDGYESLVVDVDSSRILLVKNINGTLTYIKELDKLDA